MIRFLTTLAASAFVVVILASMSEVQAGPLDDAKANGLVGEQADGYLGSVSGNGGVQALISEINAKRQAKYAEIAAKRGASTEDVAKITGKKLIERTPEGQYVKDSTGQWRRK